MGVENVLLPIHNRLLCDRILQLLDNPAHGLPFEDKYSEFNDCQYLLQSSQVDWQHLRLSFALPGNPAEHAQFFSNELCQIVQTAFAAVAVLIEPPAGFELCLEINLQVLAAMGKPEQAAWAKSLASLRSYVLGAPLSRHLIHLAGGTGRELPTEAVCYKQNEAYFIKSLPDSVTVIFAMHFENVQDAAIACAFLQEFAGAKRTATLGNAPVVTYLQNKSRPLELHGFDDALIGPANAGYMSFTFFPRHVCGPHMEQVTWSMASFRALIVYHVQCCKSWMHSRMRTQMGEMLMQLNAARPASDRSKLTPATGPARRRLPQEQTPTAAVAPSLDFGMSPRY